MICYKHCHMYFLRSRLNTKQSLHHHPLLMTLLLEMKDMGELSVITVLYVTLYRIHWLVQLLNLMLLPFQNFVLFFCLFLKQETKSPPMSPIGSPPASPSSYQRVPLSYGYSKSRSGHEQKHGGRIKSRMQ